MKISTHEMEAILAAQAAKHQQLRDADREKANTLLKALLVSHNGGQVSSITSHKTIRS